MGPLSRAVISSVVVLAAGREALAVERPATGPCHAAFVAPSPAGGALARAMRPRSRDVSALKCQGGGLHKEDLATKKNAIYIPATSRLDWREFRSRLIKAETPAWMRRLSRETGVWAHEVSDLERGCLLVETGQLLRHVKLEGLDITSLGDLVDSLGDVAESAKNGSGGASCRRASDARVILLLSHDEQGSSGLILNKPTPCTIGDFTEKLAPLGKNTIYYGGAGAGSEADGIEADASTQLHTLHRCCHLEGSVELMEGVFYGADVKLASQCVAAGKNRASDFKFFYSAVHWKPGELKAEIAQRKWVASACSKELILNSPDSWDRPLWRLVLELMGGKFALISRYLSADL